MFGVIGEAAVQQSLRMGGVNSGIEKDISVHKSDEAREARPVESTNEGEKPRSEGKREDRFKTRNRLEDGKIIVEKYDEAGRIVKRTPPGYLPFGEIA
jgi:hypothetical protein